jgi:hypothetical protein
MFHELPPAVRRIIFGECARVLKPRGRLVVVDSLQRGDEPDYEGLLDLLPQNYHEPYYASYTTADFEAIARACGLTDIREVKAFVSKVMVSTLWHASSVRPCSEPSRYGLANAERVERLVRRPPLTAPARARFAMLWVESEETDSRSNKETDQESMKDAALSA